MMPSGATSRNWWLTSAGDWGVQRGCGGAHANREATTDYLISLFGVEGDGSVTEKLMHGLLDYALEGNDDGV